MTRTRQPVSYSPEPRRKECELPEITVTLNLSQEEALRFAKRLAHEDDFRREVAKDPVGKLSEIGVTLSHTAEELGITPMLPPKHIIQEALVNISEASEFASEEGFTSPDPLAFWFFVVFVAT